MLVLGLSQEVASVSLVFDEVTLHLRHFSPFPLAKLLAAPSGEGNA